MLNYSTAIVVVRRTQIIYVSRDVSDSDGPHAFIPGSHTAHGLSRLFPNEHLTNGVINGTLNRLLMIVIFSTHLSR